MIADFHNDFLTSKSADKILKSYQKSDNLVTAAVFKGKRSLNEVENILLRFYKKGGKQVFFACEDFGFDESLSEIEKRLLRFNLVYVGMTWNYDNRFGGGSGENGRLTKEGRELIKILNNHKIALDVAHLNKKTMLDALELADCVVCSHTAFSEVNAHKRNIDREQILALIKREGLIGLALYAPFLGGDGGKNAALLHINYFVTSFGSKNLCLGTDFYGGEDISNELNSYEKLDSLVYLEKSKQKNYLGFDIAFENLSKFLDKRRRLTVCS